MKFITTKEVAEKLNISRSRVYQLIEEKKLIAKKIGRDFLIKESSLTNIEIYGKPGRPPKEKSEK